MVGYAHAENEFSANSASVPGADQKRKAFGPVPPSKQIIAKLEPAAQVYFMEELEEGAQAYYFDGYAARVKRWHLSEVED